MFALFCGYHKIHSVAPKGAFGSALLGIQVALMTLTCISCSNDKSVFDVKPNMSSVSGPSCSKLTMSLVNDSLKFTSSDTQIC